MASVKYGSPWKRILYEKQRYKDNYFDPSTFFNQLTIVRGQSVSWKDIGTVFLQSAMLVQQFSAVTLFLTIYQFVVTDQLSVLELWMVNAACVLIGGFCYVALLRVMVDLREFVKVSVLFLIILRISAPVLKTLTSSVSEDTIYAASIVLSIIHLACHDYRGGGEAVSLSSALVTAILLASRLQQSEIVVAFIVLAVLTFSLFPLLCRELRQKSSSLSLLLSVLLWAAASTALWILAQPPLFSLYQLAVIALSTIGPALFVNLQAMRKGLRGPWDLAVPPTTNSS